MDTFKNKKTHFCKDLGPFCKNTDFFRMSCRFPYGRFRFIRAARKTETIRCKKIIFEKKCWEKWTLTKN